ncbi:hypothetical protein J1N35_028314 [Gossypium stocksii]|uniref:Formin-like protein n=1 Tax=Gossypium stocksii TaxID=47602 RepID=A0A9D3UW18_9ROSI|nr:hypothetical protein J1N35_028314 [Gossypium stocksii]
MPMTQGNMGGKKIPCLIFLATLLCISLAIILDYRSAAEEAFLNVLVDPSTGEINENRVGLLWINCRQDLNDLLYTFVDPKLRRLEEILSNVIHTAGYSFANENIRNLVNIRHPELKHLLSNCIRNNHLIFQVSEEDSKPWYTRYVKLLFRRHDVPRRFLGSKKTEEDPDSDLGPSPSPSSSPSSSPSPSPSSSPSSSPNLSPAPSDSKVPESEAAGSKAPDIRPTPSKRPPFSLPPPVPTRSNQHPPPVLRPQNNSHHDEGHLEEKGTSLRTLIIACIVTALVTAIAALLFLFLCSRKQINKKPISGGEIGKASNEPKDSTDDSIALEISSDGKSSPGNVGIAGAAATAVAATATAAAAAGASSGASKASAESSATSGDTNSVVPQPAGKAGTSTAVAPPVNCLSGGVDAIPSEPPNQVGANPPPAPTGSANVPRPPGPLSPPKPPTSPPKSPPPVPPGPKVPKPPGVPQHSNAKSGDGSTAAGNDANTSKAKLKPFFWDKVAAKPNNAMVWDQIKAGSFQFSEELIETLFGASVQKNKKTGKKEPSAQDQGPQYVQLIEPKKAQNLAILLRALNVTTKEVCDALREGNDLPVEFLQTLLKMAPTSDEEHKLKTFTGDFSQLGPSEQFLKRLLDIPFAFKRIEVLIFMCSLKEDVSATKESFETLEVACKDLRGSRLFLKLLEAVLKTGNRMNDGTFHGGAQAFKLDTLLKLSDVKGVDGKTTLLHFVVLEIIRTEGLKAARAERESESFNSLKSNDTLEDVSHDPEDHYHDLGFKAVSHLSSELENVKKAAAIDAENLTGTVIKLGHSLLKARDFLNSEMKGLEEDSGFQKALKTLVEKAEVEVKALIEEEKRIMELVKNTGNYFHGNVKKDEGIRLFVVVRDFLVILDKVCKEVRDKPKISHKKEGSHASSSSNSSIGSPSPDC